MKRKHIKWIMVFIWAIIIFLFSSQKGEISNQNNRFIIEFLKSIGIDINLLFNAKADYIIRKMAHFTEYLILYVLVFNALVDELKFKHSLLLSIVITFLYAVSDEFHQSFVPGRSPSFTDVVIDTSGGFLGMMVIYLRSLLNNK